MIGYLSFRMALRHFRADFASMALSVVAVALGVALVVAVESMNGAVLRGFLDTIDGVVGRASLNVTAGEGITFSEDLIEQVAAVPGVALAVPLVRGVTFPDDGSGEILTVHGVDITHDADVRLYHRANDAKAIIPDVLQFLNTPESIVVGREFADRRGLARGVTLDLVTPNGVRRFTVRGLLDPEGLARTVHGRLIVMDLYAAQRAFTADGQINQIDVVVDATTDVAAAKRAITAVLPGGLTVEEPAHRKDVIRRSVAGFQGMLMGFGLLAVLAGFVICYSRLGAIAAARTWEVGLLRAVGLRRGAVFAEILKENLLVGVAGSVLGVPLGLLIADGVAPYLAVTTALNFRLPAPVVETSVSPLAVVLGVASGIGAAVLATLVPALQLAQTKPVHALAHRGREIPSGSSPVRWGARGTMLGTIVTLLVVQKAAGAAMVGIVTTGLLVAAAVLLVTPVVQMGSAALARIWTPLAGPSGWLALHHVRQQPRQTTLTVTTLGLGLGTVLLFGMLAWSFEKTLVARLSASERSDMVISSAFLASGYRTASLGEGLLSELRTIPGVALAAGEQSTNVVYGDQTIVLASCDDACFTDGRIYEWPLKSGALSDAVASVARGDAVFATTSFGRMFSIEPGETIELVSPEGPLVLTVAGISSGSPETAIWMSRDLYRRAWNDHTIWTANVALERGASYAEVEHAIARQLGAKYRLTIRSSDDLIEYFAGEVRRAFAPQYLLEAITLLLVVIAIADTLASTVLDRTRELGMMRAIGSRRSRVFTIVMLEGATIGILGMIVAIVTGLALGVFWVTTQFPALVGWDLDLHFPYGFATVALGLSFCLCAAGSFFPALRAARRSVVEALRHE